VGIFGGPDGSVGIEKETVTDDGVTFDFESLGVRIRREEVYRLAGCVGRGCVRVLRMDEVHVGVERETIRLQHGAELEGFGPLRQIPAVTVPPRQPMVLPLSAYWFR